MSRRKRKICEDYDDVGELQLQAKRKRHGSIGNIVNQVISNSPRPRLSAISTLQRTNSLRLVRSPSTSDFIKPYSGPSHTPSKQRTTECWQTSVDPFVLEHMPPALIRRQEAIHELLQGEKELVEDLGLVVKVFLGPMKNLSLITENEMSTIFSNIEELIKVHEDIVEKLQGLQSPLGIYDSITEVVVDWIPKLACYATYCSNQISAKEIFDSVSTRTTVADFLERCRSSSFSRKLDLWSFLDTPRRRLPKYLLLLKNIIKMTLLSHPDKQGLQKAIESLHVILADVDKSTGQAKCNMYKSRLLFLQDKHNTEELKNATALICDGPLKNKNGTKLHALLFDTVFILTRQLQKQTVMYQVYRQPLPIRSIIVEDLPETRVGGSFKRTFTSGGEVSNNFFRVFEEDGMSYQLLALSGTKKQWIDSINSACKTLQETKCITPLKNKLHLSLHSKTITDTPPVQPITPPEQRTPISETNDIAVEFMKKNNLRSICEDVENCPAVANGMVTPLRGDKSPSLMLRNGENVSRLMIERTPEPKEAPKISRV